MLAWFKQRLALTVVAIVLLLYLLYEASQSFFVFTTDAYVTSDVVAIAPEVSGTLAELHVVQDQQVKKGDPLFTLDRNRFAIAVKQAEADRQVAQEQVTAAKDAVKEAQAVIKANQATLKDAEETLRRQRVLVQRGDAAQQALDNAERDANQAQARLEESQGALIVAEQLVRVRQAQVAAATQSLAKANYDLGQTARSAPADGYIAPFTARPGDYIHAGEDVLAVITEDNWRIVANLRESHLSSLSEGQSVSFMTGNTGWTIYEGTVRSLSAGVAREPVQQGVVPYVEPSTDWIRLPRRFPVQIDMGALPKEQRLFMGADATVLILF